MADEVKVSHAIELAKRAINRQQGALALRYLGPVNFDVDELQGTRLWADHQLTYAEALSAMNDPAAKGEFEDALSRISKLRQRDAALEIRAHEHFGVHLAATGRRSFARQQYELAKTVAIECAWLEDSAHVQLLIITVDLETACDPQLGSLQNLRNAAKDHDYTAQELLASWIQYLGDTRDRQHGLVAARFGHVASVEYFRALLNSVREALRNETSA